MSEKEDQNNSDIGATRYGNSINELQDELNLSDADLRDLYNKIERKKNHQTVSQAAYDELKRHAIFLRQTQQEDKGRVQELENLLKKAQQARETAEENYKKAKETYTAEFQEQLNSNSTEYMASILSKHEDRKKDLERSFCIWSWIGALSVVAGVALFFIQAWSINPLDEKLTPTAIAYIAARSTLLASLVLVLARYGYSQSRLVLKESLRVGARINAIEFGNFYLKTYGARAEWPELRDVFRGWESVTMTDNWNSEEPEHKEPAKTKKEPSLGNTDLDFK